MVQPDEGHTTLREWSAQFLRAKQAEKLSRFSVTFYRQQLGHFLTYCDRQGVTLVEDITPNCIREFMLDHEKSHNPGGVHAAFRSMRAFLLWWERETEPDAWENPIRKVKALKVPEELLDPVPLPDVESLARICPHDYHGIRDKAIILTLLDTGVRARELTAINRADIDLVAGEITTGKGREENPA